MSKTRDPEIEAHRAWLGLLQPMGLVVSAPALVKAGAVPSRDVIELQQNLLARVRRTPDGGEPGADADVFLDDFPAFAEAVLGWTAEDLAGAPGGPPLPASLELPLPDYGEILRPTYVVLDPDAEPDSAAAYLLLVCVWPRGTGLDEPAGDGERSWHASPQARIERLLRETGVPAGVLVNGAELRLVYAPRGESSGHVTFPVAAMCDVKGRLILSALHMLLGEYRLFEAHDGRRLHDILVASRKYQNEVSTQLAGQVLGALWELLRGFQAADEAASGRLLGQLSEEEPEHIYGGLLTTLLRLVFLLYAEDQGLMPKSEVYLRNYSVTGLYERLREDAGRYPDTMDQRFGAWAWLLSLFRLVYDGGGHQDFYLPTRHGQLFDPDEYPFLEGRPRGVARVPGELVDVPRVSDGCLFRVLQDLLVLDGERLSYRSLDVEQIGSVYEAMMGFAVERAAGRCVGVKSSAHKPGAVRADPVIDIDALLAEKAGQRVAWLDRQAGCKLTGKAATALKKARTPEDVVAALGRKLSGYTPQILPPGALYLQPGEERRRSGSHYTPRELTEPIVRTTLEPVLAALGERPRPEQILELKVCDPAMGSGAFLVEACRQLAEALVAAWERHDCLPALPADEEPLLHARRLVAQRCLYGVDRNPFAVSLAKLSLWLVTLARDHAFTFLDHALKHGDSLVGLTREQIGGFHWQAGELDHLPLFESVIQSVDAAHDYRERLRGLDDEHDQEKRLLFREAEDALDAARLAGDLVVAAFFGESNSRAREARRTRLSQEFAMLRIGQGDVRALREIAEALREGETPVVPFHWEIEFPEVFERDNPGFDAMVGNPPFMGGKRISGALGKSYSQWTTKLHPGTNGNVDLVAHFYRRAYDHLRDQGAFGLLATNTIAQGDTREGGLTVLRRFGATIFNAQRRVVWPGMAAVIVSTVHVWKGDWVGAVQLDGKVVPKVTAFLFYEGSDEMPPRLVDNDGLSFIGCDIKGHGFLFDDRDARANPLASRTELLAETSENGDVIKEYVGGDELNNMASDDDIVRYVIDFNEMNLDEAQRYPSVLLLVEQRVRPTRAEKAKDLARWPWWQFWRARRELREATKGKQWILANCQVGPYVGFLRQRPDRIFAHTVNVFAIDCDAGFAILQSRVHEVWVRFFASSLEDRLRYTPSDCFETFPFPEGWQESPALEAAGKEYYELRAALMVRNDEGLTKTYNRFHDPEEHDPEILRLRELHAAMDRAVLDAYGWTDITTDCKFLLDYEIDEETWGKKKKPYRYRWPDEVHDEVLARLLALNQERVQAERLAGLAAESKSSQPAAKKGKPRKKATSRKATSARKGKTRRPADTQANLFRSDD